MDNLGAKCVPAFPITYQQFYLLVMTRVYYFWLYGKSFLCLLVY